MWSVNWPSLSLGFLSASAEAEGIRTAVFDLNLGLYRAVPENLRTFWGWANVKYWEDPRFVDLLFAVFSDRIETFVTEILATGSRLVGFSVYESSRLFSIRMAREIKARSPSTRIIFGGTGVDQPYWREMVPPSCCDAFAIGEGERTLVEAFHLLTAAEGIKAAVPGLMPIGQDCPPREQAPDLDAIPFPTWEGFPIGSYSAPSLPLLFSRGCVSRCSFCTDTIYFKTYRHRSPENLVREMRAGLDRHGVREFRFHDLMINGSIEAFDGLCECLISSRLSPRWTAMVMARKEMTAERYRRLLEAGCTDIDLGVESGSDRVLKIMRKWLTAEEIGNNIVRAAEAGIRVNISLVLGHPGEEEADFMETLEFLKRHSASINRVNNINHCLVMFRSDIRNHPERYGVILPAPPDTAFFRWRTIDGKNTLEMRMGRVRRALEFCASLGLNVSFANLFDGSPLDISPALALIRKAP